MTAILPFLSDPAWQHLGWALLHTLWQGAIIAVALALLLRSISVDRPEKRYAICLGAMASLLLAGLITWSILDLDPAIANQTAASLQTGNAGTNSATHAPIDVPTTNTPGISDPAAALTDRFGWLSALLMVWLAGTCLMLVRMVWQVAIVRRLARGPEVTDGRILRIVDELLEIMQLRRAIRIVEATASIGPAVIGAIRPVLLLPVSMMTGLSPEMLRAVLAHELAHIRRHDYLINLVQMTIEALLFFNPAIWWISRQIRIEREAACDALAVAAIGERLTFTRALADWAELAHSSRPIPAMAWTGGHRPLLDRVWRLLSPGYCPPVAVSPRELLGSLLGIALILCALWRGTEAVVAVAAQALSPAERVKQLAETEKEFAPAQESTIGKVTLVGTVRTEDGKPLPSPLWGTSYVFNKNGNNSCGTIQLGQTFNETLSTGKIWLQADPSEYAPAIVGPFQAKADEKISSIEIVLKRGFPLTVNVGDNNRRPVAGAEVFAMPVIEGSSSGRYPPPKTNEHGITVIPHAIEHLYSFSVRCPGFQKLESARFEVKPNLPITLTIQKSKTTTGKVVSTDGKPIGNAQIRDYARIGTGDRQGSYVNGRSGEVLGTSDANGNFSLNQLFDSMNYCLLITTEHQGSLLRRGVTAGQSDLQIIVGPNLTIKGTIHGPLEKLQKDGGKPCVSIIQNLPIDESIAEWRSGPPVRVPVEISDGVAHFQMQGLLSGNVVIVAGDHKLKTEVNNEQPTREIAIDLTKPVTSPSERPVVVRFQTSDGFVQPDGTIRILSTLVDDHEGYLAPPIQRLVKMDRGEAHFDAYSGGNLSVEPSGTLGYQFERIEQKNLAIGDEPLEIVIPVVPAGGIAGQIFNHDGTPATDKSLNIQFQTTWKTSEGYHSHSTGCDQEAGKFFISPLRLGATTYVRASRGNLVQLSEPVTLDAAHPIKTIHLTFPPARSADGQMLDPDGKPIPNFQFGVESWQKVANMFHRHPATTDQEGRFHLDDLSPSAAGYRIDFGSRKDYQSKMYPLVLDETTIVKIERGLTLEGKLVDAKTGWPVPGAKVNAMRYEYSHNEVFTFEAEQPTDQHGRFRFSNLAKQAYRMGVSNGMQLENQWNTKVYPGPEPLVLKAIIPDSSPLKPRKPEGEN